MKISIAHVGILVKSLEESVKYYEEVLGFEKRHSSELPANIMNDAFDISVPAKVQLLSCNNSMVELFELQDSDKFCSSTVLSGINHFAIEVDDLKAYVEAIGVKGGKTKSFKKGDRTIWFAIDPNGVLIELRENK